MNVADFDFEAELGACAARDRSAFRAIYDHEAPAMRALALAMLGDGERADAALLETFVLIWRNAAGYSASIGTARAWIYSILRYRIRSQQKQQPAGNLPELPVLHPAAANGPNLPSRIAALPPPQLQALLQAYLYGGGAADIAARTNRSEPDIQASLDAALSQIDATVQA